MKQIVWDKVARERDLTSPIPRSWNLITPRCGLLDTKKCPYYIPECVYKCVKKV